VVVYPDQQSEDVPQKLIEIRVKVQWSGEMHPGVEWTCANGSVGKGAPEVTHLVQVIKLLESRTSGTSEDTGFRSPFKPNPS
jgi:hypothetical protein